MYSTGTPQRGFTLIEMSIVLVVIGLIVGGILVGRDLIRAATLREIISQRESFQTAVNTFYGKYQALPGDIPAAQATAFGLTSVSSTCANNGLIDDQLCRNPPTGIGGEVSLFWVNLSSDTHLIPGAYTLVSVNGYVMSSSFPLFPTGLAYWMVQQDGAGQNWFVGAATNWSAGGGWGGNGGSYSSPGLGFFSVYDAYQIDAKVDDGMPNTGWVQLAWPGGSGTAGGNVAAPTVTWFRDCSWDGTAANTPAATYQVKNVGSPWACNLRFLMK